MALKKTSEIISIGASVTESAANTFTQQQVDLQLNPLDQEVFVVLAINSDLSSPDVVAGTSTRCQASISTTSRTAVGGLQNSNVLTFAQNDIRMAAGSVEGVPFHRNASETPPSDLPYLAIIATNNFFMQVQGSNNTGVKTFAAKVYGYRARADAATYAALTQSELLSAN